MHDPLALALALDGSLGATRPGTVDVELAGLLTRGMTVVDWRGDWGRPHNADVATEVQVDPFLHGLIDRIAAVARR
jgi:purine nucleosidase